MWVLVDERMMKKNLRRIENRYQWLNLPQIGPRELAAGEIMKWVY